MCIILKLKVHRHQKQNTVASYCEVVKYLLETYATDDITAETDDDMIQRTQPSNSSPEEYAEALWNKALKCHREYDEYVLKRIFMESL